MSLHFSSLSSPWEHFVVCSCKMSSMQPGDPGPLLSCLGPGSHLLASPRGGVCTVDAGKAVLYDQRSLWPQTLTQNSRETSWTTWGLCSPQPALGWP